MEPKRKVGRPPAPPIVNGRKCCSKCGQTKEVEEFFVKDKQKSDGLRSQCKTCTTKTNKLYRQTERGRTMLLQWSYGISAKDYDDLFKKQHGVCAICSRPETMKRQGVLRTLCVDHNHKTREIRGLLCCECNRMLGFAGDSADRLRRASVYLEGGD